MAAWVEWITKLSVPQRRCTLRNTIDELDQSICCFFSGRCVSGATKPKSDNVGRAHDAASDSATADRAATDAEVRLRNDHERHRRTTKSVRL
jgi:hypothetical protein